MVNFPTQIPDCDSHNPALLDLFLSSDASIYNTMNIRFSIRWLSLYWETLIRLLSQFHPIAHDYSRADWNGLHDHLRDVPWEDTSKLGASAAASDFCERV